MLIFENPTLGRVLVLDGIVQTSERDEFIYHEMMTHVPIIAHGAARDVLIIGGGDGGALEEVLKHPGVARATLVELDPGVVEIAREHLPGHQSGRVRRSARGAAVRRRRRVRRRDRPPVRRDHPGHDRPDGSGRGAVHRGLLCRLSGAAAAGRHRLVGQSGNPVAEPERVRACRERLGRVFADASFILTAVPAYLGGPFVFAWGCDDPAKRRLSAQELAQRPCPLGLRCYSAAVHAAAFVHPPWLMTGRI